MRVDAKGRLAVLVAAVLTLTSGCGIVWVDGSESTRQRGGPTRNAGDAAQANETVRRSLTDVERFWARAYPTIAGGRPFRTVQGGFHPYTRSAPAPACGGQRAAYEPNAFYCPAGDFIAWDAETLVPQLHADFGPLLVGVIAAHEYGHAVQSRLDLPEQPTVVLEQQADCFAGAWVGDVLGGRSAAFTDIKPNQLDSTVGGLLLLRDQPGTPAAAPQAHGNAFDRVRAFQEGVEQGVARCAGYRAENLPVTEVPFASEAEAATGGDLPYADAVRALGEDAQAYWNRAYPRLSGQPWTPVRVVGFDPDQRPACGGRDMTADAYSCPAENFVAFDNERLGPTLHQRIGDNAVGMLLGDLFARIVQERRGTAVQGRAGQVAVDCLAGSWTNDLLNRADPPGIRLSPGDLDEAVAALLVFGRSAGSDEASAFDRIAAFRTGVLGGLTDCT